jgi:hypothetical protein
VLVEALGTDFIVDVTYGGYIEQTSSISSCVWKKGALTPVDAEEFSKSELVKNLGEAYHL